MFRLRSAVFLAFALTACAPVVPSSETAHTGGHDEHPTQVRREGNVLLEDVQYMGPDHYFTSLLVHPSGDGSFPAIVMIHELWGINDDVNNFAKKLGEQGYVVLVVDLYEGMTAVELEDAESLAQHVHDNSNDALLNLKTAILYLKSLPYVDNERIASVGFGLGGDFAYQLAKNDTGVKASVIYYGKFNTDDDLSQMKTVIQGHFGMSDPLISADDVKKFQSTLQSLSGDHEIYLYESAGPEFTMEHSPYYVPDAAQQAWERTLNFLKREL